MSSTITVAPCRVSKQMPAIYKDHEGKIYRIACKVSGCVVSAPNDADKGVALVKKWNELFGGELK